MNIIKFNPSFNNLIDEFFNSSLGELTGQSEGRTLPKVNIRETDKSYFLDVAVPGTKKENIEISVDGDQLIISSLVSSESKEVDENYRRREFNYSSFKRSYHLPENTDKEGIVAKHENGILEVSLPKKETVETKGKTIQIG